MSRLSRTPSAVAAARASVLVASWYQPTLHVPTSMTTAYAPSAICTTSWAFGGAQGFAVANTKRSPQRLEESLT